MNINLHYLELFYYVCRHGGISKASRKMPYGIHPSTISRQLCELERQIQACLFERQPFNATPVGENLFGFIKPLFEDLPKLIQRWCKETPDEVRLGASPVVWAGHPAYSYQPHATRAFFP